MISAKLRHMDSGLARHKHTAHSTPADLSFLLATTEPRDCDNAAAGYDEPMRRDDDDEPARLASEPEGGEGVPRGFGDEEVAAVLGSRGIFPSVVGQRCGALPAHTGLSEFLNFATDVRGKVAPELRYTLEYGRSCMQSFGVSCEAVPDLTIAHGDLVYVAPSLALQAVADHQQFSHNV